MAVMVMVVVSEFKGCSVGRGMQFNKKKKKRAILLGDSSVSRCLDHDHDVVVVCWEVHNFFVM